MRTRFLSSISSIIISQFIFVSKYFLQHFVSDSRNARSSLAIKGHMSTEELAGKDKIYLYNK
jgi:hypothetical protein